MCSSHKLIAHFVKELERFICDRATPPTIDKGVAMYAYGVSVYCVNVYILTFFSHISISFSSHIYTYLHYRIAKNIIIRALGNTWRCKFCMGMQSNTRLEK